MAAQMYDNADAEVTISQKGNLTIAQDTQEITGDGTHTIDLTVPTGKSWGIKALFFEKVSGTYTISTQVFKISADADTKDIQLGRNTSTTRELQLLNNDILLPAGEKITLTLVISGHSASGNVTFKALIQEIDE